MTTLDFKWLFIATSFNMYFNTLVYIEIHLHTKPLYSCNSYNFLLRNLRNEPTIFCLIVNTINHRSNRQKNINESFKTNPQKSVIKKK